MGQVGVITEQGDMGFGFDPLNRKDEKVYTEATKKQNESKDIDNKKDKNQ